MSGDDAPSRRDFEHLSATMEKLSKTIESLPIIMAATYVRQDVYNAHREVHDAEHKAQREDIDDLVDWKNTVLKILVSAVLVGLLGLLIGTGVVH